MAISKSTKQRPTKEEYDRTYTTLLFNTLIFGVVSRPYLMTLMPSQSTAYRVIAVAEEANHIRQYSAMGTASWGRRQEFHFYGITKEGIQFLVDHYMVLPPEKQWVQFLDPSVRLRAKGLCSTERSMKRYLGVSGTAYMMAVLGIDAEPISPSMRPTEFGQDTGGELDRCIAEAKGKYIGQKQNLNGMQSQQTDLKFSNAMQVKTALVQLMGDPTPFYAGRYTGILESPLRSVLIYVGNKEGMAWSKTALKPEVLAYRAFVNRVSGVNTVEVGDTQGILFVENAKMFADIYLDKAGCRRGGPFAAGFRSFIIFPISRIGLEQLEQYMYTDLKEYEQELADAAVRSGLYTENKDASRCGGLFPLKNQRGTPMYIGTFLNTVTLSKLRRIAKTPGADVGIICYEWQIDYYRRVVPKATFMTVRSQ